MAVYLVAAGMLTLYLNAIPIKLAFALNIGEASGFAAGVSIFSGRSAIRSAFRRIGKPAKKPSKSKLKPLAALRSALRTPRRLSKSLRIESLSAVGSVCTSSAADTALICGGIGALNSALQPLLPSGALYIDLTPDFSGIKSSVRISGMISMRLGQIMLAALIGAWNYRNSGGFSHGKASD